MLEVRESNIDALSYYEKNGFKALEVRNKYYRNGEGAIIMRINI